MTQSISTDNSTAISSNAVSNFVANSKVASASDLLGITNNIKYSNSKIDAQSIALIASNIAKQAKIDVLNPSLAIVGPGANSAEALINAENFTSIDSSTTSEIRAKSISNGTSDVLSKALSTKLISLKSNAFGTSLMPGLAEHEATVILPNSNTKIAGLSNNFVAASVDANNFTNVNSFLVSELVFESTTNGLTEQRSVAGVSKNSTSTTNALAETYANPAIKHATSAETNISSSLDIAAISQIASNLDITNASLISAVSKNDNRSSVNTEGISEQIGLIIAAKKSNSLASAKANTSSNAQKIGDNKLSLASSNEVNIKSEIAITSLSTIDNLSSIGLPASAAIFPFTTAQGLSNQEINASTIKSVTLNQIASVNAKMQASKLNDITTITNANAGLQSVGVVERSINSGIDGSTTMEAKSVLVNWDDVLLYGYAIETLNGIGWQLSGNYNLSNTTNVNEEPRDL
jgi:hypothetical protein